jgi:nicotinamidase-related amidase
MENIGIPDRESAVFVMIDIQDKFVPVINDIKTVIKNANILSKAAEILNMPFIFTEQYPQGLGRTTGKISVPSTSKPIEKIHFSCLDCKEFADRLDSLNVEDIVLFGIEAHICVLNTALDLLKKGYRVHVVADAVSSRTKENKEIAIERMRQSGIFIVSTEMILFHMLDHAKDEEFSKISELVK